MSEPANDNRLGLHFTAVLEATRRAHEQSVAYLEEAERLQASDPSELTRAAVQAAQTVFRLAKVTPFSGISASKNDPLSLRL